MAEHKRFMVAVDINVISVTPTTLGSVARTRTPMGYSDSTFQRALTSHATQAQSSPIPSPPAQRTAKKDTKLLGTG
jgi:hypothetical protein